MLLASFFFASMGVCIKFASEHFNSFELVCYRGMFGVLFLAGLMRVRGVSLRTPLPMMHFWRSVVGVAVRVGCGARWFIGISSKTGYLPATVIQAAPSDGRRPGVRFSRVQP